MRLQPHRRFNPLNGEWVLVSPQRTDRPWLGQVERAVRTEHLPDAHAGAAGTHPGGQRRDALRHH